MRNRKALFAAIVLLLLLGGQTVEAARFVDLQDNWAEKYINMLSDQGVINAEPDGQFRPNQPVTRAVFAYWLVKVLGLENQPVPSTSSFPDVKTADWFFKPVEIIRQNNYISGYADGFRPNQFIQKAEVITILSRTLDTPQPDEQQIDDALAAYSDKAKIPSWARTGIAQATRARIIVTEKPGVLGPTTIATRGETAALLYSLNRQRTHQSIEETTTQSQAQPQSSAQSPAQPLPGEPGSYLGGTQPAYQGKVSESQPGYNQPQSGGATVQAPPPPAANPPVAIFVPQGPPMGYPPLQGGFAQSQPYPPPNVLMGRISTVSAGTKFQASLKHSLDSGSTQPGEPVEATLGMPLFANGQEVIPAGSKLTGNVTNVVSAKRFKFGANGKIDIKFTAIETPDGRKFPLSASVDDTQLRMTGGTGMGRVGKGLVTTGVGAAGGAALGTALGAIVGATSDGSVGKATGMGAAFGTALGGGVGLVGAGIRKGSEAKIVAGTALPVRLDDSLQVTSATPAPLQPYYVQPYYGGAYGAPPIQPPPGYMPPY